MDAIHVRRVAIRCRVDSAHGVEKERAQRVFRDDIAAALEEAVALVGIAPDEQICIRKLQLSATLWIGLTDAALRRAWAEALAADIRRAITTRDTTSVVRYASSVASVIDALRGLARGDMARQWAWQQLGLATAIAPGGGRADAICGLLLGRPHAIVAALRALSDEPSFWRLLAALDDEQMENIADAALTAAGINVTISAIADAVAPAATEIPSRARFVVRRARAARQNARQLSARRAPAIAVLATLEVEPALLRGDAREIGVAIASVAAIIRGAVEGSRRNAGEERADSPSPGALQPSDPKVDRYRDDVAPTHERRRAESAAHLRDDTGVAPFDSSDCVDAISASADGVTGSASPADVSADYASIDNRAAARHEASHKHSEEEDTEPRDCRIRARSEWAGLLFLINVLRDGELIDSLLDDSALAHRPSQWVLHRLALALVPSEPTDAAALAFAGLAPGQLPADFADDAPNADEQSALLRHARACVEAVCARLEVDTGDELLYAICARPGEIVADPGWIEVRFPLDTIAVDLRRAGLDLDPGYVSWLGIVMKFAYV